jgi:hypothetical protein
MRAYLLRRPDGGVVTQRSAKPFTPVQFRVRPPSRDGGTGIHDRLKICWPYGLEGSSPSPGTIKKNSVWSSFLFPYLLRYGALDIPIGDI